MRKLFIWGAGEIGKRVQNHLSDWEIIFVDSNKQKTRSRYCGKMVISINEYLKNNSEEFILIAHLQENESLQILAENSINNYFIHCDLPGEFKEPFTRNYLREYICNYLRNRSDYILTGLNLYSIIVDGWIYKRFGIHPYILVQDNISKDFVDKIIEQYKGLNLINSIKNLKYIKELCVCSDNYMELKASKVFDNWNLTDIFDCTDRIKSYHNQKIEEVHNLHEGKRVFIVATGPSLKIKDLDLLKGKKELCISMNGIFYAFDQTDWRPDYYVMSDYRGYAEYLNIFDTLKVKRIFLSDNDEEFWKYQHEKTICRYHQHYEYCFNRLPKFSEDFSKRSYASATVTYTCLQLAVYMGFKKIYLLGVDFTYGGQEKNKNYKHFHKEENLKAIGFVRQVTLAYKSAKQYAESHGVKIYNATRGGNLEIFERVDFDNLFYS